MHPRIEAESSTFERLVDGPSRKHLGDLGDVALRVSAIHAKRMEFQQLSSVILVQATVLFTLRISVGSGIAGRVGPSPGAIAGSRSCGKAQSLRRVWPNAQPIIEIEQHRWALRGCDQQILKLAQGTRANDL